MKGDRKSDLLMLLAAGALLRFSLLLIFPEPYGNDSIGRLYFKDSIFLSHWLPLTQLLVWLSTRVCSDVTAVRFLFAAIGTASALGFYLYLREIVSRRAALLGGFLFTFNGLYVVLSLMPYQGPLFLGLYYGGLTLLFRRPHLESMAGSLLFGLASLTRYETWFVIPVLGLWKLLRDSPGRKASTLFVAGLRVLLFFGWAPLLWFLLSGLRWGNWSGFLLQGPNQSFYGWHPHFDLAWAAGYLWRTASWIIGFGSPLVVFAVWGLGRVVRRQVGLPLSVKLLLANGLLVLLFFFFIIGQEQGSVFRFVLFPLSVVLVLTTLGLEGFWEWLSKRFRFPASWLVAPIAILLAVAATVRVHRVTRQPVHRVPYNVVRFLETHLATDETALVIAERSRDPSEAAPMGYQRIAAIAGAIRPRILSSGLVEESRPAELDGLVTTRNVRYLIRFRDPKPWVPADIYFASLPERSPQHLELVMDSELAQVFRFKRPR